VEKIIDSKIQNLDADRKEILSKANPVEDDYAKKRKYVSSILLFITPVILALLSLSSTADELPDFLIYSLDSLKPYLLPALIVVIGVGITFFFKYDRKKDKIHTLIQSVDSAYLSSIRKLDFFRQYYNNETYYVDFNEDRMNSLFNLAGFASMAVRVDIIKPLENMLNSHYFEIIKGDLCDHYDNAKETMNLGVITYESNEQSWAGNYKEWRTLRPVFREFFTQKGYWLGAAGRMMRKPTSEKPKTDSGEEKAAGAPLKV
jgi:hypothetical protein